MFTTVLTAFLLPVLAAAQYGPPPGPAAPTTQTSSAAVTAPSAPADTPGHMNINVAFQNTFTFNPANITAPNGTLVTFWFPNSGIDHSVTQSSFAAPCTYLAASSNTSAGFDSGLTNTKQFTINITDDTKPIWFHCKQVLHCGMGMVGSINAPQNGTNTFDAFMAAAMKIGSNEQTETDNGAVTGGVNGVATAAPAASSGGASPAQTGSNDATKAAASVGLAFMAAAFVSMLA
ncbi:Cupredoxin [Crucibulum laeve]|uniref:Cupredoxin n=1 Tax=Crucibulum laeve TaxID=68775 RepID=A0A5C3MP14_9AGAR|nr:Cupredoxin [Crucibulum laeve]